MRAYHDNQAIKDKYIAKFAEHRRLDKVIQRIGFSKKNGKGCFIGCMLDKYNHPQFSIELGWPLWLVYLAEVIFEGLPIKDAAQFGTDLLDAIPVGVDLEPIRWKLAIWRHTQHLDMLKDNDKYYAKECISAIKQVISICEKNIGRSPESIVLDVERSAAQLEAQLAVQSAARLAWDAWETAGSEESGASAQLAWLTAITAKKSDPWAAAQTAKQFRDAEGRTYMYQEKDMLLKLIKEC